MKKISLDYCGMEGEGKTVREAKRDATRKIEAALSADYTPRIISFRGETIIIWRSPKSTASSLLHGGQIVGGCTLYAPGEDRKRIEEQCRLQLAQTVWNYEEDLAPFLDFIGEKNAPKFLSWVRWQNAYRQARHNGATDIEAHGIACSY